MHPSAFKTGKAFFDVYAQPLTVATVVDIGAQNVNGSLKAVCPTHLKYIGVDFVAGKGVDTVLDDPYTLPFDNEAVDIVVCSSCFEHAEMFWVLYLEILRILKSDGLFYLNVPSNGEFHRYPVDCWRFYPDSGRALVTWAKRNHYTPLLLESFVARQDGDLWNDFVAVFLKDESRAALYPERIVDSKTDFVNGLIANRSDFINPKQFQEDQEKLMGINQILSGQLKIKIG